MSWLQEAGECKVKWVLYVPPRPVELNCSLDGIIKGVGWWNVACDRI